MRNYTPTHIRHQIARLLFGRASLDEIACEHHVVCKEETVEAPPSIFLPGQLEKVKALHPRTSWDVEKKRLYGGKGVHGATRAYRLKNVKLRSGGLYKGNWSRYFPRHLPPAEKAVHVNCGSYALASSFVGIKYFGHWLGDDLACSLLAADFAKPLCIRTPQWPHQSGYCSVFDLNWDFVDNAEIDELYIFNDAGQNSHKIERFRKLRAKMRERLSPSRTGHRVYLRRGATGATKRIMSNEAEIIETLEKEGFLVVDVGQENIDKMLDTLLDARMIVTIEGSNGSHSRYCLADHAGLLTIQPPRVFNNVHKDWSEPLGMKYATVVGDDEGEQFRLDASDLLKTVDLLEAAL